MAAVSSLTPQQRITLECARRGRHALVAGCVALLHGRYADIDDALVVALGGEHGQNVLAGSDGGKPGYWPRVWQRRRASPCRIPPDRRASRDPVTA